MPTISRTILNDLIDLLSPFMDDYQARQVLIDQALGLDERSQALRGQMDFDGPASNFVVALVRQLISYGEVEPGKQALWAILEVVRPLAGVDRRERIDALEAIINMSTPQLVLERDVDADHAPPSGDHVFVSYAHEDKDIVLRLINGLERTGVRIWVDQSGLPPRTPDWEQALRDAIRGSKAVLLAASPDSRSSVFVKDEVRIAQMYKRPIYPVWVNGNEWMDSIPMGMGGAQYVDARGTAYTAAVPRIAEALRAASIIRDQAAEPDIRASIIERDTEVRNPYKGLQAFTADDRRYFFGRDALVDELVEAMNDSETERFLPVVGASGSGKSSVVMAGLIPRLQADHPDWTFLKRVVPGAHPLERLAEAIAPTMTGGMVPAVVRELHSDAAMRSLHQFAAQINETRTVLFVDQFEELFTLTDPLERDRFIDLLTTASTEPDGSLSVILTMRADFMDRPLAEGELARLFQDRTVLMQPMDVSDLRDVIVRPAELQGLTFDENLVGDLLFEVRSESGVLPLLQFTLTQLYERRDGDRLTRAAYTEIGGVRGAITKQAEQTYDALPSGRHRDLARALFLRLIEPGQTDQETTRRRITRSYLQLPDETDTAIMAQVADTFTQARLLVATEDTVEVAHEALIREWNTLNHWLLEARDDLRIQQAVNSAAAQWADRGRAKNDATLFRGDLLDEAIVWLERSVPTEDEQAFVTASAMSTQRRRRLVLLAWVMVASTIFAAFATTLVALSRSNDMRLQQEAIIVRQEIMATLAAGGLGSVPFGQDLAPRHVFATAAKITELNEWNAEDPVIDEGYEAQYGVAMVLVPAGCFWMGSVTGDSDEQPVHEVCFNKPFWIDRFEVTNEQFEQLEGKADDESSWTNPDQPRTNITWFEARRFCEEHRGGARLPTEAQWEYAARGPDSRVYPWGNSDDIEDRAVSYFDPDEPADVGEDQRSGGKSWVGAYDMCGNVWEWVADWYDSEYYSTFGDVAVDPQGPEEGEHRVRRGGSFGSYETALRSATRQIGEPDLAQTDLGFRCVRIQ